MEHYKYGWICHKLRFSFLHQPKTNQLIMSDAARKDVSDKVSSAVKPDSQKSTIELAKDKVTDTVDNLVGDNSRSGDKSVTQQASDSVFGEKKE